jgi:DNA-binding HxlR family transcriptional regulator
MTTSDKATYKKRSDCAISSVLELIGDKWSLLIIRDMLFLKKSTYNEFLDSSEKISTNILQDKLIRLTELGLITYTGTAKRKKYALTKLGLGLKPVLEAIGTYGTTYFKGVKHFPEGKAK